MKKLILFFILLFTIAGCSQSSNKRTTVSIKQNKKINSGEINIITKTKKISNGFDRNFKSRKFKESGGIYHRKFYGEETQNDNIKDIILKSAYRLNKNVINYDGSYINADLETFEAVFLYYGKDKNHVYFKDKILSGIDSKTFKIIYEKNKIYGEWNHEYHLDDIFFIDKDHVYLNNKLLTGINSNGFELLYSQDYYINGNSRNYIVKNNEHIFLNNNIITGADPISFQIINKTDADSSKLIALDKSKLYIFNKFDKTWSANIFTGIDTNNTESIRLIAGSGYSINSGYNKIDYGNQMIFLKKNNNIYCQNQGFSGELLLGADPDSFQNLGIYEGKFNISFDDNSLFIDCGLLSGADPHTFEVYYVWSTYQRFARGKDKNRVYEFWETSNPNSKNRTSIIHYKIISNNPKDYPDIHFDGGVYLLSDKYVYCNGNILTGSDPDSFRKLNSHGIIIVPFFTGPLTGPHEKLIDYYIDNNQVYFGCEIISTDVNNFIHLGDWYAKDSNNLYLSGKIIEDKENFHFDLGFDYYIDFNNVYYKGKIIEGANIDSFQLLNFNNVTIGIDNNYIYNEGIKKNKNIYDSYKYLGAGYEIIFNKVYYNNIEIEGADVETFKVIDYGYAKDKNNNYRYEKINK